MPGIGEAEIEAGLEHAKSELAAWEGGRTTVFGADADRRSLAGAAHHVAIWLGILGRAAEAQEMLDRAQAGYLAWLEGTSERVRSAIWLPLYRAAILNGWTDLERALLARGVDPDDGDFVRTVRPWIAALHALGVGDEAAARRSVDGLRAVPEERIAKDKWYPRLGDAVEGLLDRDAGLVSAALEAVCERHVSLLKHGSLFTEIDIGGREPALIVAVARRRGIEPQIPAPYRAVRLKRKVLRLQEWEGRPLGRETFEVDADITDARAAWTFAEPRGGSAGRPAKVPRPKLKSQVPEAVVREWLRSQGLFGPPWAVASRLLLLGDAAAGRSHLLQGMQDAERSWQTERVDGRLNRNLVFDHLSLALAVGADRDLEAALDGLRRADAEMALPDPDPLRYSGPQGPLRFLADLITTPEDSAGALRDAALSVSGTYPKALVPLLEGDQAGFDQGLAALLAEHVGLIDRRYPAATPIAVGVVHCVIVGRRRGLQAHVDEAYRRFPVPFLVTGVAGHDRAIGHLPCDLLGEELWEFRHRLSVVGDQG